jgi:ABC-type bacteriocin/lantibiotic exporter with double-glycine peptidase domain
MTEHTSHCDLADTYQALARALFVRCDVIVLDDFFSALDGETEKNIFDNLFGPGGALRRNDVTTILVSNSRMLNLPFSKNIC